MKLPKLPSMVSKNLGMIMLVVFILHIAMMYKTDLKVGYLMLTKGPVEDDEWTEDPDMNLLLKKGERSPEVKILQNKLLAAGQDVNPNGIFCRNTEKALYAEKGVRETTLSRYSQTLAIQSNVSVSEGAVEILTSLPVINN
jgi:hypothetical protein